jgi:phosphatidylglycerol:prolipoprotein diacylglycerol transferase
MHPILCHVAGHPIHWYGVLMAAAFVAATIHWRLLGRQEGRDAAFCTDLAFWIMIAGIVGARIAYVLANLEYYADNPLSVIRVDQGGLVFYGGFLGGGAAVWALARRRGEPVLGLLDFVLTALPLGHALGRIGCFLNGCCYGRPTDAPWGIVQRYVDAAPRHPVQLYEAAGNLLLYVLLLRLYRWKHRDGQVVAVYLLIYPLLRFAFEWLRGDERVRWAGMTAAQWSSIALLLVGAWFWSLTGRRYDSAHNGR